MLTYNIKVFLGWVFSKAFAAKFAQAQQTFTQPYWGKHRSNNAIVRLVERLMRFYLAHSDRGNNGGETLENIHKQFWQNQIEDKWFDNTSQKFDESIPALEEPMKKLKQFLEQRTHTVLCEIGTGDGRFLDYLRARLSGVERFIGLDLSERRIVLNRTLYDGLEFVAGDAREWVPSQDLKQSLFVTNGGVLEYFRPESLETFVRELARAGSSLALFYEPLVADHDLDTELEAKLTTAGEYSFSHNYPALCRRAGMDIVSMQVNEKAGYRGICMIASSSPPSAQGSP
jgi:hypothetical protein